jgi:hypothetical protein
MRFCLIDDFSKISRHSSWFDDLDDSSKLVVLIEVLAKENGYDLPVIDGMKQREVDEIFSTPGCFLFDVEGCHLAAIDSHRDVLSWSICRKRGAVEFSDDQIWNALLQHDAEFRPMSPLLKGNRTEFRSEDPIGYIESMSAMERVLYRAVGYI